MMDLELNCQASMKSTAYNWLSTISLKEHDFYLSKTKFWDSIHIRHDILLKYLFCGQIFNLGHALSCNTGGFITLHHSKLRDFKAQILD